MMRDPILIRGVKDDHGWLGNMAPFRVEYDGLVWRTTEALFQALRFPPGSLRLEIHKELSPMGAKMRSKTLANFMIVVPRSPQDVDQMRTILKLKLEQHPTLKPALAATAPREIIEDCSRRQSASGLFWGAARVGDGWRGGNQLGKLWMELRADLRPEPTLDLFIDTLP
jgi:predicted NAD-dependent protein-ADP-ribosyltransferase YbiA (DUF1768 family)